ncbi:MAG: hypothetical protein AAF570_21715, partial [Bacteroidota bacterium]
ANLTLSDSITAMESRQTALNRTIGQRDRQVRRQIAARDSLQALVDDGVNRENALLRDLKRQESRIDSLMQQSAPVTEQQKFIRDQWAKLDAWEKELKVQEGEAADREKLLSQRENVLAKNQENFRETEEKAARLQDWEDQLRLREQQLNAREGVTGTLIRPNAIRMGKVVEFGNTVPVYIVETELSYKAARKQVVAYMLERDELLDEQFPDIMFRGVSLPEIHDGLLDMKVRIDTRGNGSILQLSFQTETGAYLTGDDSKRQNDKAKTLISNLLRYKN